MAKYMMSHERQWEGRSELCAPAACTIKVEASLCVW